MIETIGKSMKRIRKSRNLFQRELSEISNVPLTSIREYEEDLVLPGLFNLIAIADALNVTLDELIGRKMPNEVLEKNL